MTREQRRRLFVEPLLVWAGLLGLLAATFGYAHLARAPLGGNLAIATVEALLIAAFSMQLRRATGLVRLAALAGLVWASMLYLFAFADFLTR